MNALQEMRSRLIVSAEKDISLKMMEKHVVSGNKTTHPNLKLI